MKNLHKKWTAIFLAILITAVAQSQVDCINGGAETVNFTNWTGYYGGFNSNTDKMVDKLTKGFLNGTRHKLMDKNIQGTSNIAYDPWAPTIPVVNNGNTSIRLGDDQTNTYSPQAEMIGYTFTVTNSNKIFKFNYAVVLQDGHQSQPDQQPAFGWYMVEGTKVMPAWYEFGSKALRKKTKTEKVASSTDPFFKVGQNGPNGANIVYRNWTCQKYDLSKYVGKKVTIWFYTKDCGQGAHFGYAYIDGLCEGTVATSSFTLNRNACDDGGPIWLDGTASDNEDSYFLAIQECDANGVPKAGAIETNQWFVAQKAGKIDIKDWYVNKKGQQFKCNTYYKVKLAVTNECSGWYESSKVLYYYCVPVNAGPDKDICCGGPGVTIGTPAAAGYTYSWTSMPAGFTSTLAMPTVNPNTSTSYILTAKDANGCRAQDVVDVFVYGPFQATIVKIYPSIESGSCSQSTFAKPSSCDLILSATPIFTPCGNGQAESATWQAKKAQRMKYLWSTGENTQNIISKSGTNNYSVTVTSPVCGYTANAIIKNVQGFQYFQQSFKTISADYSCFPDMGPAYWFVIREYQNHLTTTPAYGAYRYRLTIWDRWGHVVRCITVTKPQGLTNKEIVWDGKDEQGNIVPIGVYNYQLRLWNCATPPEGDGYLDFYKKKHICNYHWYCLCTTCYDSDTEYVVSGQEIGVVSVIR